MPSEAHETMPDAPFHLTRQGARFFEHTLPELVRQLARLSEYGKRLLLAHTMR